MCKLIKLLKEKNGIADSLNCRSVFNFMSLTIMLYSQKQNVMKWMKTYCKPI